MEKANDITPAYSGSCNPPRRAKRLRTDSITPAPTPSSGTNQPRILPKPILDDNDEPELDATPPPPRRRGRKPGALSKSARESLRKENHSRIEKARRTKINDALATLRELVPVDYGEVAEEDRTKSKRDEKQKEFKLEVLVRTVAYMQDLIVKVEKLEEEKCISCGKEKGAGGLSVASAGLKRKRPTEDEERDDAPSDVDELLSDEEAEEEEEDVPPKHTKPLEDKDKKARTAAPDAPTLSPPALPSISTWLPKPYVDPSYLALSPQLLPHLPSPPLSTPFRPTPNTQQPPSLLLPSPHPFDSTTSRQRADSLNGLALPQAWTVEDESAASMLLKISSRSSSSGASPPPRARKPGVSKDGEARPSAAATPGSVLGLGWRAAY
ncbi:hypothetical protein OE88DRAFT_1334395 [Heliocybe sulcata]|uniref:BHLH domain-containing protein n=1 Tax=Heliocybe sulcata TaxID=5364 RepID=A0A5C3N6L3_9AGAM|nr:hypothetical protein OE88DRAFT_1334395 [Heliocybe sulcata]